MIIHSHRNIGKVKKPVVAPVQEAPKKVEKPIIAKVEPAVEANQPKVEEKIENKKNDTKFFLGEDL